MVMEPPYKRKPFGAYGFESRPLRQICNPGERANTRRDIQPQHSRSYVVA
jgi:hypothetical protein